MKPTLGAVLAALIAGNDILLIRQPDRQNPRWKLPGGEIEPGEDVVQAFAREITDETKFKIRIARDRQNRWIVDDDSITIAHKSVRMRQNRSRDGQHQQHFFVVVAKNPMDLLSRGNELIREDDGETIETKIFPLDSIQSMPDFLDCQRPLIEEVLALRATA